MKNSNKSLRAAGQFILWLLAAGVFLFLFLLALAHAPESEGERIQRERWEQNDKPYGG